MQHFSQDKPHKFSILSEPLRSMPPALPKTRPFLRCPKIPPYIKQASEARFTGRRIRFAGVNSAFSYNRSEQRLYGKKQTKQKPAFLSASFCFVCILHSLKVTWMRPRLVFTCSCFVPPDCSVKLFSPNFCSVTIR